MKSSKSSKVSVIIPTLNEEKYIGGLLFDIQKQTLQPDEVIVVDGKSTDKTVEMVNRMAGKLKGLKVKTLDKPNVGRQRTLGGEQASGDILFFLDADVRLKLNFIDKAVNEFEKQKLDVACPFYQPISENGAIHAVYTFFNIIFFLLQKVQPSGAGSCIIVRKKVFDVLGGFVEDNTYDDIIFIRKALKYGVFGTLYQSVDVSSRRFEKYGVLRVFLQYLLLSVFFLFGAFRLANRIRYEFGRY